MQNQFILEKETSILASKYHGDQTQDTIREVSLAVQPVIQKLRADHLPVLLLIDLSDIQGQTAGARLEALNRINGTDFDKLAMFGAGLVLKQVISFLIKTSTKGNRVRYFDSEQPARAWLLS